jgi:acyl-CoA thioester hydrolase
MAPGNVFTLDIDVRFRDLDAMGHVNNAVVFTYFEEGRKAFFLSQQGPDAPWGFNFILARIACEYLQPVTLEDRPMLRMWIGAVGTKSFEIGYELADRSVPERVFARGSSTQVCYDYARSRSIEIPTGLRQQLNAYLRS